MSLKMVLYHNNWQLLPIPQMIALFERNFSEVTFLPSSAVIFKLKSIEKGSCVVLENKKLFTIYYIPEIYEIYKVESDKTTQIKNEVIQPNCDNQTINIIANFCTYDLGGELFIEHLNKPRFKAIVITLKDNSLQLDVVRWIDNEPSNSSVADAILKDALVYLKNLQPVEKVKSRPHAQNEQSIPTKYNPIKPNFCIYNIWGESFVEHQYRPRFKAQIISNDGILKLNVVVWIDNEPSNSSVADAILKDALVYVKNLQPVGKVKSRPHAQKEQSIPTKYNPIKPNFCIYNIWGESFIEHQYRPRFKAQIISNDGILKLNIVVWIDNEPKAPNVKDDLLKEALQFLIENPPNSLLS